MSTRSAMRIAFYKWLEASVAHLSQYTVPKTTLSIATSDDGGVTTLIRNDVRIESGILVGSHAQELLDLPQSIRLTKAMVADTIAVELFQDGSGNVKPERHQNHWIHTAYLHRLLTHYLTQVGGVSVDPAWLKQAWRDLSRFIYDPTTISVSALVDIRGVEPRFNPVKLGQQTSLRPLTLDEAKTYLQTYTASGNDPYFEVPHSFLEVRTSLDRHRQIDEQPLWNQAESSARSALAALRLLRGEIVGLGDLYVTSTSPLYSPSVRRFPIDGTGAEPFISNVRYPIDSSVAQILPNLWKKHQQLPLDRLLDLSFRRLADSYTRRNDEDKMLDYWIALEAMFLSVDSGELSYRGSLRIGRFVGKDAADRKKAFEDMKDSYTLRSKIVHGSMKPKHQSDLPVTTEITADILRRILRRCLDDGHSPDVSTIDDELLA